jgi:opacity protein-like surface antigen
MIRFQITLIVAVFIATAAFIGTAASRTLHPQPPPPPPTNSWAGPYVGLSGGYGWGSSSQTDAGIPCTFFATCEEELFDGSYSTKGGMVGGTLGYSWQRGAWVAGLEGDYSGSHVAGSSNTCGANTPAPHACGTDMQSFGTIRGRLGYAVGSNGGWLPYVTGGLAVGDIKSWDAFWPASSSDLRAGWTVGGGIATLLTQNLTLRLEYLYADFGHWRAFDVVPGTPETVSFRTNILRAGIDYTFR